MNKAIVAMVDFALAAFNVWLALTSGNPISWAAAAFCFGCGIITVLI